MKRVVIVLALLLVISMVSADNVDIKDMFKIPPYQQTFDFKGNVVHFYAGDKLIASKTDEVKYHYQDLRGSDFESKQLPFGQELVDSENRFEFTRKELDDESGLNYFGARYYDSEVGKFTSVDPVKENHAYVYVANNPFTFFDPDGRDLVLTQNEFSHYFYTMKDNINLVFGRELLGIDGNDFLTLAPANFDKKMEPEKYKLYALLDFLINGVKFKAKLTFTEKLGTGVDLMGTSLTLNPTAVKSFYGTDELPLGGEGSTIKYSPIEAIFFHEGRHLAGQIRDVRLPNSHGMLRDGFDEDYDLYQWASGISETFAMEYEGYMRHLLGMEERVYYAFMPFYDEGELIGYMLISPETWDAYITVGGFINPQEYVAKEFDFFLPMFSDEYHERKTYEMNNHPLPMM